MEELEKDMQKAIQKHLPAQLGAELQKLLEERVQLMAQLKSKEYSSDILRKSVDVKALEIKELTALKIRKSDLDKKAKDLDTKARNIQLVEMEIKLTEAEKRADLSKEFVTMIFKSPVYRKNVSSFYGHGQDSRTDHQGFHSTHSYKTSENINESIEED